MLLLRGEACFMCKKRVLTSQTVSDKVKLRVTMLGAQREKCETQS